jgi:hypothetical protein
VGFLRTTCCHHFDLSQVLSTCKALFAQLSRGNFSSANLDETACANSPATGRILNIERVSLWGLTSQRESLECIDLYELSRNRHSRWRNAAGASLPRVLPGAGAGEPIVADDAMKHPSTQDSPRTTC